MAHLYNSIGCPSDSPHLIAIILDGQCWPLDCDGGCNRLELAHDVHRFMLNGWKGERGWWKEGRREEGRNERRRK